MHGLTRITVAVVCALGVSAAIAQTIQPRIATPAEARPPLQTAQTPDRRGAAAVGASTATGATAPVGTTTAGTVAFVGLGAAAVAGATSDSSSSTVTHNP